MARRLFLLDASSLFYRAFYAIPRLRNSKGFPTNALSGFCSMLLKIKEKYAPDYAAVVFDAAKKTFRNEIYKDYKATRQKMPEDLAAQIPYLKKIPALLGFFSIENEELEADDIIATLTRAHSEDCEVVIVTTDKDLFQLINKEADDQDKPGVIALDEAKERRIGIKEVVEKFGVEPCRLRHLLALTGDRSDNVPGIPGVGEKTAAKLLSEFKDIDNLIANACKVKNERLRMLIIDNSDKLKMSLRLVELKTDGRLDADLASLSVKEAKTPELLELLQEFELHSIIRRLGVRPAPSLWTAHGTPLAAPAEPKETTVELILESVATAKFVLLACADGKYYGGSGDNYCALSKKDLLRIIDNDSVDKFVYGVNWLYDAVGPDCVPRQGVRGAAGIIDLRIASFMQNPDRNFDQLSDAYRFFTGNQLLPGHPAGLAALRTIKENTWDKFDDAARRHLADIEMPVASILWKMSRRGVRIDAEELRKFGDELTEKIQALRAQAYLLAGCEFNLDSPKQLQDVLYKRLGLSPTKKTKTGFSTDVGALQELEGKHPIITTILEYRTCAKLRSGFVESLLGRVEKGGRVHTTFNQIGSATGRIITSEPNLQNIPVRGEFAHRIRGCFAALAGYRLVTADYSQIELRLLAHFSGDEALVRAFRENQDVHTVTAAELFGVAPAMVTPEMRRKAKEVNFSIIYGITPHGLAGRLRVSRSVAKDYIDRYFKQYPGVKSYLESILERARNTGYVTTILGRKRFIEGIDSRNKTVRQRAERVAVNSPLQGSASDILKLALIMLDGKLSSLDAFLIMQVHDEIITEVAEEQVTGAVAVIKDCMERAIDLTVPLLVSVCVGSKWSEAY